jgi:DNA-directed RNA polymerase subunit RPC12/RpoP
MDKWNKTHCDKCKAIVGHGFGIYADGGFYHRTTCWEEIKQGHIDNYEWEELNTALESEVICPYCGYVARDSWELSGDDGENTCGRCEKEYNYTRNVEITYTTTPIG